MDILERVPSLRLCCQTDVFEKWSDDGFQSVAEHYLNSMPDLEGVRHHYLNLSLLIHRTFASTLGGRKKQNMGSPGRFLELLRTFRFIVDKRFKELRHMRDRYTTGVERLDYASCQIEVLQEQLRLLRPQLIETSIQTDTLMKEIEHETVEVENAREVVASNEAKANDAATNAQSIKVECELDLAEAIPALERAVTALHTLKASDIGFLKTMRHPPTGIKLVMEAVCILLGEKPLRYREAQTSQINYDYWPTAQKILSDFHFIDRLKNFARDDVSDKVMDTIRRDYTSSPDFMPEKVRQASLAAEGICLWVGAIEVYNRVAKIVEPKRERLKESEREVKRQLADLKLKRNALQDVTERLQHLNDKFGKMTQRKQDLELEIRQCEVKTERAERLIKGLGGEESRWDNRSKELAVDCEQFVASALLCAVLMVYLSDKDEQMQKRFIEHWRQQVAAAGLSICDSNFSLSSVLSDPNQRRHWQVAGLADDAMAVQNATLIYYSRRWPLIIDPQGEAKKWLSNTEKTLKILKMTDNDLMMHLKNSITTGQPVLIENITEILDPRLNALFDLEISKNGSIMRICLGGETIEYNDSFRLFLSSQRVDLELNETALEKVCLVNFDLTERGVEEHLLDVFVSLESPDLQKRKESLIIQSVNNRNQLRNIEIQILKILEESKGNVLDDEHAVETLSEAKDLSDSVIKKQQEALATEKEIDKMRDSYRPLVAHSAKLVFLMLDMGKINPAYKFSLDWFVDVYKRTITTTAKNGDQTKKKRFVARLQLLKDNLTATFYKSLCSCLFNKDRLVFSFLLATKLADIKEILIQQFLTHIRRGGGKQGMYISSAASERTSASFDRFKQNSLDEPSNVVFDAQEFVSVSVGSFFLQSDANDLNSLYRQSKARKPIVLILSEGVDVLRAIVSLADKKRYSDDRLILSSVDDLLEQKLEEAMNDGCWLVLQNCHLLDQHKFALLEKFYFTIKHANSVNDRFRMWLIMMPSNKFPATLLQNGMKLTIETPVGVKSTLLWAYENGPASECDSFIKQKKQRIILYQLCFLHGLLKERQQYKHLGWHEQFLITDSDLETLVNQFKSLIKGETSNLIGSLKNLFTGATYSGRINNEQDLLLLECMFDWVFYENSVLKPLIPINVTSQSDIVQFIHKLPLTIEPRICGLNQNASLLAKEQKSYQFLEGIDTATKRENGVVAKRVSSLSSAKVESLLKSMIRTNTNIGIVQIDEADPLYSVITVELSNTANLVSAIEKNLRNLTISNIYTSAEWAISENRIPIEYQTEAQHHISTFESFVSFQVSKIEYLTNLSHRQSEVFDLSMFAFPTKLIHVLLQDFARRSACSLADIDVECRVMDKLIDQPLVQNREACVFNGLSLIGASWDEEKQLLSMDSNLYQSLPSIILIPRITKSDSFPSKNMFLCPAYKRTATGLEYLFKIAMSSDKKQSYWVLSGIYALSM